MKSLDVVGVFVRKKLNKLKVSDFLGLLENWGYREKYFKVWR